MKRVIALGDLHCGHRAGLTPPGWQLPIRGGTRGRNKWGRVQHELWGEYLKIIEKIKPPIDVLIANGDLIDGRGEASGGTELITSNRNAQAEMAVAALSLWEARNVVVTIGTPYHTGKLEDLEKNIAKALGGDAYSHPFIEAGGVVFDCKHKVGRSSIPHGRGTPLSREWVWNVLKAERDEQPKANIFIRSHVHYFRFAGEKDWLGVILPALQAAGTKYGARQVSGTVDWGLVEFDVEGGEYTWVPYIKEVKANKAQAIVI